jgi:hypothetical protein
VSGLSAIGVNIQKVSVAGETIYMPQPRELVLSAQLLSTLTEASGTLYYLYLTPLGEFYFDTVAPRNKGKKLGYYHPKYYWRNIHCAWNKSDYYMAYFIKDRNTIFYYENGTGSADGDPANLSAMSNASITTSRTLYQVLNIPVYTKYLILLAALNSTSNIYNYARGLTYSFYQDRAEHSDRLLQRW